MFIQKRWNCCLGQERREKRVEKPFRLLLQSLPTQAVLEQPILDLVLELSSRTDEPLCFIKKQSYAISASVGRAASVMKTVDFVLDTSASSNILHLRYLAESWRPTTCPVNNPASIDVSNLPMRPRSSLVLFVQIAQLGVGIRFLVVASMALDCTRGTTFIDGNNTAALPPQRKTIFLCAAVAF